MRSAQETSGREACMCAVLHLEILVTDVRGLKSPCHVKRIYVCIMVALVLFLSAYFLLNF